MNRCAEQNPRLESSIMAPKLLIRLSISVLYLSLRLFLLTATIRHLGLMLWSMIFAANIPDKMGMPPDWRAYLSPLEATPGTFDFYICALTLNLAWDTLWDSILAPPIAENPKFGFFKPHLGETVFVFWIFFDLATHYYHAIGSIPEIPSQLDQTLLACFLLRISQVVIEVSLLHLGDHPKIEPAAPATILLPDPPSPSPGVLAPEAAPTQAQAPVDLEKQLLDFIGQKGQVKTGDIAQALGIPVRTVNHYQKKLILDGRIVRVGQGKLTMYRLGEPPKDA